MPIKYNPKDAVQCLPEGQYSATLEVVNETTAKSGREMHELKFRVYGPNDRQIVLTDRIVYPEFTWKLKKLAKAFGEEASFDGGYFDPESLVNHNLVLDLVIRVWDGSEQNDVKGYIKSLMTNGTQTVPAVPAEPDDDLPF